MESLLIATVAVAAAEMGDKTQLLSLLLCIRFARPWAICAGILLATAANHAAAAWLGQRTAQLLSPEIVPYLLAATFVGMGLWLLYPDEEESGTVNACYGGVLLTTTVLFFLAEMGDKTQLATMVLGARFPSLAMIVVGSTLGMLLANVPVVFGGRALLRWVPVRLARRLAAALFVLLGAATLLAPRLLR